MEKEPIQWTPQMGKKFKNALCGLPANHKDWQEYYDEGDYDSVYEYWKDLAEKEEGTTRLFWRAIMKVIAHKTQEAKE